MPAGAYVRGVGQSLLASDIQLATLPAADEAGDDTKDESSTTRGGSAR